MKKKSGSCQKVRFLGAVAKARDAEKLKLDHLPKVVFAGRSNVGKSSLLNALTASKAAFVSQTPGKTREINFFEWRWHGHFCVLVDLPGYGYAKVPGKLRNQWGKEITQWLTVDPSLKENKSIVVALADGRHGFMKNDLELIDFLQQSDLPFLVAFTKMDKWKSKNQRISAEKQLSDFAQKLNIPKFVFVSVKVGATGIVPLKRALEEVLT